MTKKAKIRKGLLSGEKLTPEELAELADKVSSDDIRKYRELTKVARDRDTRWRRAVPPGDGEFYH